MNGTAVTDVKLGTKLLQELTHLRQVIVGAEEAIALAEELFVAQVERAAAGLGKRDRQGGRWSVL